MSNEYDFVIEHGVLKEYHGFDKKVVIPNDIWRIDSDVFSYFSKIESITIPEGVAVIGNWCFHNCTSLTHIDFPKSLTRIGYKAFENTPWEKNQGDFVIVNGILLKYQGNEEQISIPESVKKIEYEAFAGCTNLTSVIIPESVTKIERRAFSGCSGLSHVTISKSVEEIGESVFYGCINLISITILGSPTISNNKLSDNPRLAYLIAPNLPLSSFDAQDKKIAIKGFAKQQNQRKFYSEERCTEYRKYICRQRKRLYDIALSDEELLYLMLSDKIIPKEDIMDLIDRAAVFENANITAMLLDYQNQNMTQEDKEYHLQQQMDFMFTGVLSASDAKRNWRYEVRKQGGICILGYKGIELQVTVPAEIEGEKVVEIGKRAFAARKKLTNIIIPEGIIKIGEETFRNCIALTSITIPESVTEIGDFAFWGCTALKNITLPANVIKIGSMTFCECTALTSIALPANVIEIDDWAFCGCTALTSITLSENITKIGKCVFNGCRNLFHINIPQKCNIFTVEDEILLKNRTQVVLCPPGKFGCCKIPGGVIEIGKYAFSHCENLTDIIFPGSVKKIDARAFDSCTNLTHITIPTGMTEISIKAFSSCVNLTSIIIPESVIHIGTSAFCDCPNLTIRAPMSSYAEQYAKENNINFNTI